MPNADRLIEIYHEANCRPAGPDRDRFLAEACQNDSALLDQVVWLLRSHSQAGNFLKTPVLSPVIVTSEKLGDTIGRYKLLEQVGEGGCGVVYVAEQTEPVRRRVALKVIKLGMDTKQVIARFEAERQALALMDHPNIAKVLDAGSTAAGRPYFVMELVRGVQITEHCDGNQLPIQARLDLFVKVCHAIQHAHQKGIIHRDIKPSNVLVTLHDGVPIPKVIDFGLAKAIEGRLTNGTVYTQFFQFVGTPAYMSPEQAEMSGVDIDTRSDIYSLGVLLYELLTGQPPFDGEKLLASGVDAMRKTIRETEPVRPSSKLLETAGEQRARKIKGGDSVSRHSQRTIDSDLDWIVMKCLEKDRSRRYETTNDLTADLSRHSKNEAIYARPPNVTYKLQKAWRRNKLALTSAGAVLIALLTGLTLSIWQAARATHAQGIADRAQQSELMRAAEARKERDRAIHAEEEMRLNTYATEINLAFRSFAESNLGRARELLGRQRPKSGEEDLRGFEWRYLWKLCQGDELATFSDIGAQAAAFSPEGKYFAYSDFERIIVRETASHDLVTNLVAPATSLSFAPHTNLLASGIESGVTIWNTETWKKAFPLPKTEMPCLFSPDGSWLLTGAPQGYQVWNTRTWTPIAFVPGAPRLRYQARNAVAFSPDGRFLVVTAGNAMIGDHLEVWRLPGMERSSDLRFDGEDPGAIAFSANGKRLIVGLWSGDISILDFPNGEVIARLKEHSAWVTDITEAANSASFATTSSDRTINLWDASSFKHLGRLRGHVAEVWCAAMSPDGRFIVSGSNADRYWMPAATTKIWSTDTREKDPVLSTSSFVAGFLADGVSVAAVTGSGWCVWDSDSGRQRDFNVPAQPGLFFWGKPYDVAPRQSLGALGHTDGTIDIWNLSTGAKVTSWFSHTNPISVLAFSRDGKRLASGTIKGEVKIWNTVDWGEEKSLTPLGYHLDCLAFSPDDRTLAISGANGDVRLFDMATQKEIRRLAGHGDQVPSIAFSPDGRLLATTTFASDEARLWQLPSGTELVPLKGHVMGVTALAFSPDGKTLATGSFDRKVKLWHIATHQELTTFPVQAEFPTLLFSGDGLKLAVGDKVGKKKRIQVFSAPSLDQITNTDAKRDRRQDGPR